MLRTSENISISMNIVIIWLQSYIQDLLGTSVSRSLRVKCLNFKILYLTSRMKAKPKGQYLCPEYFEYLSTEFTFPCQEQYHCPEYFNIYQLNSISLAKNNIFVQNTLNIFIKWLDFASRWGLHGRSRFPRRCRWPPSCWPRLPCPHRAVWVHASLCSNVT